VDNFQEVELKAGVVRYRDTGQGPTLVFVHGVFVNGTLWDGVAADLARDFRCLVPDWPLGSHRPAMRADADLAPRAVASLVAEFMAALDLTDVTLVGNDTGGAITQMVAAWHPDRLAGLVLTPCDTYDNFLPRMFRYLQVAAHVPGGVFLLVQSLRLRFARRLPFTYGWLTKRPIPAATLDAWLGPLLSDPQVRRDTAKVLRGIRKRDAIAAAADLKGFGRPVLVAFAPEAHFFPMHHAERLVRETPGARLALIDDAGAFAPIDQPVATAALIRGFVGSPPTT
jgi:pimeloyl-ACP methyl ester carboxylesterase